MTQPDATRTKMLTGIGFFHWGVLCICLGFSSYCAAIVLSVLRLLMLQTDLFRDAISRILWFSGFPTTIGIGLAAIDLALLLPNKRRAAQTVPVSLPANAKCVVALTAYNDEASIYDSVKDFVSHPRVLKVVVVSNNSTDQTIENAVRAGATVYNEPVQGYGSCVYRCFSELVLFEEAPLVVLCEGDMTFRANDLDKFFAYMPHADIINGTRIVEQLRDYETQLSTFMYYGNFFVGKLLEAKHLGKGTFTDVGTTYKMIRREALKELLPRLNPRVNLEFNAHFLDTALRNHFSVVECPITFHSRVGKSKGGNVNNLRALKVGMRMITGLFIGWPCR